jgi:beta-lactamase regulating signal transducer with metallopeptidase domain
MITIPFLAEWALRSSILILAGLLLLAALRVKDPSIRLAAWTAMLGGSLAIPALTAVLPGVPLVGVHAAARAVEVPMAINEAESAATSGHGNVPAHRATIPRRRDWTRVALTLYVLVAFTLLLRLCAGLAISRRLLRSSRATGRATEGTQIRESDFIATPVTLGIMRPAVVLPSDWRDWNSVKLEAVLAHERSHIRRCDPAVQLLALIHRALLWHSPLSWFLHKRIVRAAEEASDDAAVAATRDRSSYAAVLLDFMRLGARGASWLGADFDGVPMARYGRADQRVDRILDATALSRGVTRWSVTAILTLGAPVAYLVAAGQPQSAPQAHPLSAPQAASTAPIVTAPVVVAAQAAPVRAAPVQALTARLNYETGTDGYLLHRGTTAQNVMALMDIGGDDLQDQAYELRKRNRNFVMFHRHGKTYLIEDPETVRLAWKEVDAASTCRGDVGYPFGYELQKDVAVCRISEAELTTARKLKETQGQLMERRDAIEIVTDSHLWDILDLSISAGTARTIEP